MSENRSRFVLLSQQTLALAVVSAVALSAAGVTELQILPPTGETPVVASRAPGADLALVSAEPVEPTVRTVKLSGVNVRGLRALPHSRTGGGASGLNGVLSAPEATHGLTTVGVTWKHGENLDEDQITVSVRTRKDGAWSDWQKMNYGAEHGPDPGSAEARRASRPGTDAVVVGDVDQVQVRAVTVGVPMPDDLALAIVDPGKDTRVAYEKPAIDTGRLASATTAELGAGFDAGDLDAGDAADGELVAAGTPADVTPKPQIFSRAQWGADERLRDKPSLHYGEVHAGFVHHTVNANDYTKAEVPSILRGIYAYHTQSRGWSDVGYNFLVDRFGRIWEGRYGGVDRPVVGAHTLGYNDDAFAMSAIGNFEGVQPSEAMVDAYARLFAWKLSLHGIDAASTRQVVAGDTFHAINGHRDAGQTACPGRYLYTRVPDIRRLAAQYQHPFSVRNPRGNLSGNSWPDLLVRDRETKHAVIVRTDGQFGWLKAKRSGINLAAADLVVAAGDLDGDGRGDIVARDRDSGIAKLYTGSGGGAFVDPGRTYQGFTRVDLLVAGGDLTGDGKPDLVGRLTTGQLRIFVGNGSGGFSHSQAVDGDWSAYDVIVGAGDVDGDKRDDLLARIGKTLYRIPGTGAGLGARVELPGTWGGYDVITVADMDRDGVPDVVGRGAKSKKTFVHPGDGQGGFSLRLGPWTRLAKAATFAAGGQLDGSAATDMLAVMDNGSVSTYAHNNHRNFGRAIDTGVVLGNTNLIVNTGDWNGDGIGDFMAREGGTGVLYFYKGLGRQRFADPVRAGTGWDKVGLIAAVGDVTGDGFPDLMGRYAGQDYRIYPGDGDHGFKRGYVAHSPISANGQVALGLSDSDGAPDSLLRATDGTLWLWRGNGPGGLMSGTKIASGAGGYTWLRGIGDLDGDGRGDVLAQQGRTGKLYLLPGKKGGLASRKLIGTGFDGYDLLG